MESKLTVKKYFGYIIVCFSVFTISAQTPENRLVTREWGIRLGYMEYNNSTVIPSGLPGLSTAINYSWHKRLSEVKPINFEFRTNITYGHLIKHKQDIGFIKPYHHAEILTSGLLSYSFPISKFNIDIGGGILFQALAGNNSSYKFDDNYTDNLQTYGNWLLMPTTSLRLVHQLNRIKLKSNIIFPICVGGFYQNYQDYPILDYKNFSYLFTPNTFTTFNKYTAFFAEINCFIPLILSARKKHDLIIGLYIDYIRSNVNGVYENKRNIGITLGIHIQ